MDIENKNKLVVAISLIIIIIVVGISAIYLIPGPVDVTGRVVMDQPPIFLKLSRIDYTPGQAFEGNIIINIKTFPKDLKILGLVGREKKFEVALKDLLDKNSISYGEEDGKITSSGIIKVDLSYFEVNAPYELGLYMFRMKFSDDSFEDSENFDVIS